MLERLGPFLRAMLSVALVAAIVWWVGADDLVALLGRASVLGIAAVILLHIADRVLMAYKWWRLLRARGYPVRLADTIRSYFLGSFVGAVVPVAGGADVARITALRGKGASTESLISSVALERAIGAISHGFFCLGAIGLAVALSVEVEFSIPMLAAAAVVAVIVLTLGLPLSFALASAIAERTDERPGFLGKIGKLADNYAGWRRHPGELWVFLALTLVEGLYPIFAYHVAAQALGVQVSLVQMAIAVPLAFLIPRLPIPMLSFGPEQFAFIYVAGQLGVSREGAGAVTFLFLGTLLIAFAPGAIAWFNARDRRPDGS